MKPKDKRVDIFGVSYMGERGQSLAQMLAQGRQTCLSLGHDHLSLGFEVAEGVARWPGEGGFAKEK